MSIESEAAQLGYDRAKYGVNHQDLEAMGERAVRDALNSGKWGHAGLAPFAFVSAWLADKEFLRTEANVAAATAAAIAASEANVIARSAKKIALIAAIAAIVAAIAAIKWR